MSRYRLQVYKGRGKQPWRWRVRARNGKIVACSGEGFVSRRGAARAYFALRQGHVLIDDPIALSVTTAILRRALPKATDN